MNKEQINDRAKLIYHRWVSRRLGRDATLVNHARTVARSYEAKYGNSPFVESWIRLLDQPLHVIRGRISDPSQEADFLRSTSPFPLVGELSIQDQRVRRKLWRKASRFALSRT
jgi:hypothetical protein